VIVVGLSSSSSTEDLLPAVSEGGDWRHLNRRCVKPKPPRMAKEGFGPCLVTCCCCSSGSPIPPNERHVNALLRLMTMLLDLVVSIQYAPNEATSTSPYRESQLLNQCGCRVASEVAINRPSTLVDIRVHLESAFRNGGRNRVHFPDTPPATESGSG
jgi:hypothetical protein